MWKRRSIGWDKEEGARLGLWSLRGKGKHWEGWVGGNMGKLSCNEARSLKNEQELDKQLVLRKERASNQTKRT